MRSAILLLPRILAAAFFVLLTLTGGLTLARPLLGERMTRVYADWTRPLLGMQVDTSPLVFGWADWLGGRTQAGVNGWINTHLLQRPVMVRAFNSAQWATFHTSYMASGSLVRGRDDVLFEMSYIGAYCGFDARTDLSALPEFATRLKAVQNRLEARGQRFVYVAAAVKTPALAADIPSQFPCPRDQRDLTYQPAIRILRQAGVRVVDTRQSLSQARAESPVGFFPRNGIHWNRLGTAIAARALVDELRRDDPGLRPLTWTLTIAPDEVAGDRDLLDLLNLWRDPPGWPSPLVTPTPGPRPTQGIQTLVAVNDSFFGRMAEVLHEAQTFQVIRGYGYLAVAPVQYGPEGLAPLTVDLPAIRADILDADVVVLEEVESRIGGPFASQFLDLMEPALGLAAEPEPPKAAAG